MHQPIHPNCHYVELCDLEGRIKYYEVFTESPQDILIDLPIRCHLLKDKPYKNKIYVVLWSPP